MRRIVAAALCLLLTGALFLTQTGVSLSAPPTSLHLSYPSYEKLDKEAAGANGVAKGKELNDPQHRAYLRPTTTDPIGPKPVPAKQKGIAILIDFPEATKGVSEVTDVRYGRLPESMFDELLNSDIYNPYANPAFSSLATWTDPWDDDKEYTAPTDSTLKNYFDEVSYGQFSLSVDLTDWLVMPHSYDYYLGEKTHYNTNGDAFIGELVEDAIAAATDAGVKFADYARTAQPGDFDDLLGNATSFEDENGNVIDRVVPNIFIIHRGTGAEYYGSPTGDNIIWSHKWSLVGAKYYGEYYRTGTYPDESTLKFKVVDGVAVNVYNICPEVGGNLRITDANPNPLPNPPSVGVFAHEFSHVLGVPDQYDYGYESEGTGMFSLMAGGSSGRTIPRPMYTGTVPVHLDAWSKIQLGFVKTEDITTVTPANSSQTFKLHPLSESPDVVRIDVPGSDGREYFLLENRQQIGFDAGLGHSYYNNFATGTGYYDRSELHGLVIYHINSDAFARSFSRPNEAQNWDNNHRGLRDSRWFAWTGERHYAIQVLQADGRFDMERGVNDGDAADAFPGTQNVTLLGAKASLPVNTSSLTQWSKTGTNETGISIQNIAENEDGIISFNVVFTTK